MPRILSINTEGAIEWQREDVEAGSEHAPRDEQIRKAAAEGKSLQQLAVEYWPHL